MPDFCVCTNVWLHALNSNETLEEKARMMRAILNKFRKQHPAKQKQYGHLPPILPNIQKCNKTYKALLE